MKSKLLFVQLVGGSIAVALFGASLVMAAAPTQPTNSTPVTSAASQSKSPTLTASAFIDTDGSDTHSASQWQISSTSGSFSTPIWDSEEDTTNKTSIVVPVTLDNNTKYYWHVRYKDNNGEWSAYSSQTSFTPGKTNISTIGNLEFQSAETAILAVMVNDGNDDPVLTGSGATATIDIFSPSQTALVSDGSMTYLSGSEGVFYYGYTIPAAEGVYTFTTRVTYNGQMTYAANSFHVSPAANTIETNLDDTISSRSSTGAVSTLTTNLAVVDGNVDDIETLVTTIDTNVDDIEDTVTDTNDRVRDIQDDLDDLQDSVDDIDEKIDDLDDLLDTIYLTLRNEHATLQDGLTLATNALTQLSAQIGFTGSTRSVWQELAEMKTALRGTLTTLGVQTANLEEILELDTAGHNDITALLNSLAHIKAVNATAKEIIGDGAPTTSSVVQSWFSYGSIIQNFLAVNPTKDTVQTAVVGYLPAEITEKDVLDRDGMKLEYDDARQQYKVSATISLAPGASQVFRVEMEDVFTFDEDTLAALVNDAETVAKHLKGTDSFSEAVRVRSQIVDRVTAIRTSQKDITLTAEEKIETYRQNNIALTKARNELAALESLEKVVSKNSAPSYWIWILGALVLIGIVGHSVLTRSPRPRHAGLQTRDEQARWHAFLNQFGK